MRNIYRFTLFSSNPFGNGGDKRTAQITELLSKNNRESQIIPSSVEEAGYSRYKLQKWSKAIVCFIQVSIIIKRILHPRSIFRTIRMATQLKDVFNIPHAGNSEVILWESTKTDFSFIVPLFKKKGYRIVAIPHNIESLVPLQTSVLTRRISPDWFMDEINLFRKCDLVFAISREDTLLLNQFGVKASYLPYFPTDEVFESLIRIRKIREQKIERRNERKKILLLGSAVNPITRDGMINRIDFFNNWKQNICEIIIVGYETGQLKSLCKDNDSIVFYGEVTNEELNEILLEIDMLLVYQPVTSGALTRIVEMLIAGIPILVNFAGARDYFGTNGVYVYNDDEQLVNYLAEELPVPLTPCKPTRAYDSFVGSLEIR